MQKSPGTGLIEWNENKIFKALNDPERRRLLLTLAKGESKAASELESGGVLKLHSALKHLAVLRAAGLVMMKPNPGDGRRGLYYLSPHVSFKVMEEGRMMNFGFCMVRVE